MLIVGESCLDIVWTFGLCVVGLGLTMCGSLVYLKWVCGVSGADVLSIGGVPCVDHGVSCACVCIDDLWLVSG